MGPANYPRRGPGAAVGAPDHPHRGFETVTYVLEGEMEHKNSPATAACSGPATMRRPLRITPPRPCLRRRGPHHRP
jgi:hypothetical protein